MRVGDDEFCLELEKRGRAPPDKVIFPEGDCVATKGAIGGGKEHVDESRPEEPLRE